MSCSHQPRLEIDISVVVKVGITPLGVFIVGHTILDDASHVFRIQHVGFLEITRSAYFVTYPMPFSTTVKQLLVHGFGNIVASVLETL